MTKAKLVKLDSYQKNTDTIRVKKGDVLTGHYITDPIVGTNFCFIQDTQFEDMYYNNPIFTSMVVEIIDNRTFKTKNSLYKIVTIEDERDEKIKLLLD
jgi:hypothetical protein